MSIENPGYAAGAKAPATKAPAATAATSLPGSAIAVPLAVPIDVLTLVRPGETVHPRVLEALEESGCHPIRHHLIEGPRAPGQSFYGAIAAARNEAKRHGTARFVMSLDSDVVLPRRGIRRLLLHLLFNGQFAAIGINYQGGPSDPNARHVAMGAVLFRREVLERITFRTEKDRCDCASCCEDIREMGYRIGYAPGLRARHLR